jgi:lysophospholipase L1-like esterase
MDGVNPKVVVLMIGVNNIFQNNGTNEEIVKGVAEVIKQIHAKSPESKILLLSVLPLKAEPFDKRVQEVNPLIAKLAGEKVTFFDLTEKFRAADGKSIPELYVADGTHLAAKGYETWAAAMKPEIEKLLK